MVAKIIQMIQFIIVNRSKHHRDRLLNVIGYHQMNGTKGRRGGTYPDGCSILDLDVRLLEYGMRHGNGKLNEVLKEISSNIYVRVLPYSPMLTIVIFYAKLVSVRGAVLPRHLS